MSRFAFTQVDVFTATALRGNPLAVVHGADALDEASMQAFARWTNLSETTFLLAPTDPSADYRVRIFTPGGELPFAGHPTLGSCHAWRERGGRSKRAGQVVQQCGVGLVRIKLDAASAAFAAPPLTRAEVGAEELDAVLAALGTDRGRLVAAQFLKNGPNWLSVELDSAATVLALEPDAARMKRFASVGVVGAHPAGSECAYEVRGFIGRPSLYEDPVTGSLNAGLGEWLIGSGRAPERYLAAQGTRLGRAGRVRIAREGTTIWVGGDTVTCIRGDVEL
jgi:PhzF family phenazine biosynthesis protein